MREREIDPNDRTPFNLGKELKGGFYSNMYEAEDNKRLLIKRAKIEAGDCYYRVAEPWITEEEFRREYQENLRLMEKHFGDYLPRMQLVYGEDDIGHKAGYLITEKVIEDKPIFRRGEMMRAMDTIMSKIITYFREQLSKGDKRPRVPEFYGEENIRYGHTKDNKEKKFYIVDIYPLYDLSAERLKELTREFMAKYPKFDFPLTEAELTRLENESIVE